MLTYDIEKVMKMDRKKVEFFLNNTDAEIIEFYENGRLNPFITSYYWDKYFARDVIKVVEENGYMAIYI